MAPNSLFAILLRSRWWISWVIAAVIVLLAMALLPQDFKLVGALACVPFFALGIVALIRQIQAIPASKVDALLAQAGTQNWPEFSDTLRNAWMAEGYSVEKRDHAACDLWLDRQGKTAVVSAKRWKAATHGMEPLKQLSAAKDSLQANDAVYVALHPLHENAAAFAKQAGIVVLSDMELATLLNKASR